MNNLPQGGSRTQEGLRQAQRIVRWEHEPPKIAIFRALYLGDLLLAVPALRSIRARFSRAEITLIVLPWLAAFARRFSAYIDRFVAFVGYPRMHEVMVTPRRSPTVLPDHRATGSHL